MPRTSFRTEIDVPPQLVKYRERLVVRRDELHAKITSIEALLAVLDRGPSRPAVRPAGDDLADRAQHFGALKDFITRAMRGNGVMSVTMIAAAGSAAAPSLVRRGGLPRIKGGGYLRLSNGYPRSKNRWDRPQPAPAASGRGERRMGHPRRPDRSTGVRNFQPTSCSRFVARSARFAAHSWRCFTIQRR